MTHTQSKIWKYDPKEMEKLLSQLPRGTICKQLGVSLSTLNNYIKTHQIQYTKPQRAKSLIIKKRENRKPSKISVDNSVHNEIQNPLELFKKKFEQEKRKRMLQELKDGYY